MNLLCDAAIAVNLNQMVCVYKKRRLWKAYRNCLYNIDLKHNGYDVIKDVNMFLTVVCDAVHTGVFNPKTHFLQTQR